MNPQDAVQYTEVDGIPTLFTRAAGPMRAGLVFRVGVADETLGRAGLTHLTEHLALHRQGVADYHYNGATKAAFTHFHVEGAEHEIVAYLTAVCASLVALPMDRLETEKEILRTEESRRESAQLPLWRYGAQGYGLVSYPEWGVRGATPADVADWAYRWFNQGNAVLWIAGERVPPGLSLKLPAGPRHPMPAVTSALPVTPAYFSAGSGGVLLDAVVTDTVAARLYAAVLERELSRALRQEGGYSYTAAAECVPRRDGSAVLTAFADALPAKQDAVLGGFVDVLAGLRAGRVAQADLDVVRAHAETSLSAPDATARRLPGIAEDLLAGRPVRTADDLRAELRAVTPEHLRAVAWEAAGTALLQVPARHSADWAGFTAAPACSPYAVTGRRFAPRHADDRVLVVGDDGVSLAEQVPSDFGDGVEERAATVLYRSCAAVLAWPDGARRLIGTDGIVVHVEPDSYGVDAHTMALLDAAVPPEAVVRLPPRQKAPRAEGGGVRGNGSGAADRPAAHPSGGRSFTAWQVLRMAACGVAALFLAFFALVATSTIRDADTDTVAMLVVSGFLWLLTGLFVWPVVRIWRRVGRS